MAYNANIPTANQAKNASQPLILENFQLLAPWGNGYGSFSVQGTAPTFGAGIDGIYNRNFTTTGKNELFVHKQTNAGTADIAFTASFLSNNTPGNNAAGWTYLPSGLYLYWDTTASASGLTTITLTGPFPIPSRIFTVLVTPVNSATTDQNFAVRLVNIVSNTQFRLYFSSRTSSGAATGQAKFLVIGQ